MPMSNRGLTKMMEESGELVQIGAKLIAYPLGDHPDKKGPLSRRLEDEIADVKAAIAFVELKLNLDRKKISHRASQKLEQFTIWDAEQ